MRKVVVTVLGLCLPLAFACAPISTDSPEQDVTPVVTLSEKKKNEPPVMAPEKPAAIKSVEPAVEPVPPLESVVIDGKEYIVPPQWQGRRIDAKPLAPPALTRIPLRMTYEGSSLYMLEAANKALQTMEAAAGDDQVRLVVHSAYRSAWYQRKIFKRYLSQGRTFDDIVRYVAPPGYSEHALGTTVDFYPSDWRFAQTAAYNWLKNNANRFHFYASYPQHGEPGLPWEAWHWRWIPPEQDVR